MISKKELNKPEVQKALQFALLKEFVKSVTNLETKSTASVFYLKTNL